MLQYYAGKSLESHGKGIKLVGMDLLERIINKKTKFGLY